MMFISGVLRFLFYKYQAICSILRVASLNTLYPGARIDYKTNIASNCSIVCVKGGKLDISNCSIKAGTQIFADKNSIISIKDSFIGRNCVIAAKENITIKKGCLIAEMVVIRDQDHLLNASQQESREDKFITAPICIEENVWLASKTTILKGVTVGAYVVTAASAVVNTNIPAKQLWGGIPAKFIKQLT
ncbi:MAG: hypothetical protein H7Z13_11670 [Ferruginibacter sp.]|nr:hypothetical protein [Ferruginibacter sp.]